MADINPEDRHIADAKSIRARPQAFIFNPFIKARFYE
jgi:hypothetical protein